MQALISKKTRWYLFAILVVLSIVFNIVGCSNIKWTRFLYYNRSEESKIYVTITGIDPDPSPGFVVANPIDSKSPDATLNFSDPVTFNDKFKITWTIDESKVQHEQEIDRKVIGVPAQVKGGRISFTYTKNGTWEIKYTK